MKTLQEISGLFDGVKWSGNGRSFQAKCPCHDDRKASLTVSNGDNGGIVFCCHAGCPTDDILKKVGLGFSDVSPYQQPKTATSGKGRGFDFKNIVAEYRYRNGTRKLRDGNKNFLWQHLEGNKWKSGRGNVPHMLYLAGPPGNPVYVVEGEKDADNTGNILGLCAVSPEDGASSSTKNVKWYEEYTEELKGKDVILIPDNDDTGRIFMQQAAERLSGVARSIKLFDLKAMWPELPEKGDISDVINHFDQAKALELLRSQEESLENWTPEAGEASAEEAEDVFSTFGFYSVPELTEEERKPPEFIVSGMIPVGMSFLSGAPKTRKSFLALQIAIAVASGGNFFGHSTTQCDVAYLDLEGSKSRAAVRTQNMTVSIPKNVYVTNRVKEKLSGDLVSKLRSLHQQNPQIRLIIIDTYSRARGPVKASGANAYDADVIFLEPIQQMAIDENIAILFVHHDKKGSDRSNDPFERLSGTMGISGSADSVLNLIAEGKRAEGRAKLEYTSRDAKGGELNLVFDDRYTEWQLCNDPKSDIKGNPVCSWILKNKPEPKTTGIFKSYAELYKCGYGVTSNDDPGKHIRALLQRFQTELFTDYKLGIQLGVKNNGERGIRITSYE